MIYVGSLISGFLNGLFASGAGQILVFMFIFIFKIDTHKSRATSIFVVGIVTIITFIRYLFFVDLTAYHIIIVLFAGGIFGALGSKIMKKINSNWLNLISGIVITGFSLFSIIKK